MMVFDLKHAGSVERVAVIGSCRLRTPLATMKKLGKIDVLIAQPALTHSFAEARQNYRHALGEARVPDVFAPYVFQKETSPPASSYPRDILDGVKTVLVEMCDARQIHNGEWVFQNNYFAREFVQKRAAELLEWYRAFTKGRDISPEIVEGALAKLAASGCPADAAVEDILRNARLVTPDQDRLVADAEALAFDRSKRWIFVSHFAIPDDAGSTMRDRRRVAGNVEAAAAAVGAEFFNPTRLIEHYGRRTALRGNGTDIYEYDWDFIPVVGEIILNMVRQGVGPELLFPAMPPNVARQATAEDAAAADDDAGSAERKTAATAAADVAAAVKLEALSNLRPDTGIVAAPAEETSRTVNALLVELHRERLARLGAEKSGLGDPYVALLASGDVVRPREVEVARVVLGELPPFRRYTVLKAGLGSVPLMLALSGRDVTAFEFKAERVSAIDAAVGALTASASTAGERMTVQVGPGPGAPRGPSELCIAVGYISRAASDDEDHILAQLSKFDALLIEPRTFLRHRTPAEQELLPDQFRAIGFGNIRQVADGMIFAAR